MIKFRTNGKKECTEVHCEVDFGTTEPSDRCIFHFVYSVSSPNYAYLLAEHFQKMFKDKVRKAHQRAYEIGYRDGRGKQKRKTNFDNYLGDERPAY